MYNAPAVTYPVGRSRFQTGLTLAVVLSGGLVQVVWWQLSAAHGVGPLLGLLLWLVTGNWALWHLRRPALGQLVWDGQSWLWCSGMTRQVVEPQVIIDAQHSLLLCLHPESGAARWVWPAHQAQPARWLALRRALFNPAAHSLAGDSTRLAASPQA